MVQSSELRRYLRGDRVYVTAQQLWLILTGFVMWSNSSLSQRSITYGELAQQAGYPDPRAGHMLGRQLGIIGHFCLENSLPALNSIVVNKLTGLPGDEVVCTPGRSIVQEQQAVLDFEWYYVGVPTTGMLRKVWQRIA